MSLLADLKERGCIHDTSHFEELSQLFERESIAFYCGFDPTAESLHVGSMLPLVIMRKLQEKGHTPIVVLGSATGMIGDPSGKSEERRLLDQETIERNVNGIETQVRKFLRADGPNAFRVLKNHEWLHAMNFIDFLRDVGKHFSVNMMLAKDSVKARLENREQGISYTEFSYMLLQAYDYYYLNKHHGCRLQVGGSDQWGNITAGLELIRRKNVDSQSPVFGMTFPLITTASGAKFGKTEKGAVWLDAARTSPYAFYQYWMNTGDADVIRYLLLFTDINAAKLKELTEALRDKPEGRAPQRHLAETLTTLVHGTSETERAVRASRVLFGETFNGVDSKTLLDVFSDVPAIEVRGNEISQGLSIPDLLVRSGAATSKGAARRLIEGGGIYLNNERVADAALNINLNSFIDNAVMVIRSGKKNYYLIKLIADSQ